MLKTNLKFGLCSSSFLILVWVRPKLFHDFNSGCGSRKSSFTQTGKFFWLILSYKNRSTNQLLIAY